MRILAIAGFVCAALMIALLPVGSMLYADAFPSDSVKREALDGCAEANPGFDRLFAAARRACYDRSLEAKPAKPAAWPAPANASGRRSNAG